MLVCRKNANQALAAARELAGTAVQVIGEIESAGGRLGSAVDLVRVKPGFARNYLLPQGKAAIATKAKVKELEHQKRVITEKLAKELKDLEAVKHKIESIVLEFTAQAGEEGKLFGSITAANIAEQLGEKGIEVDRGFVEVFGGSLEVADTILGEAEAMALPAAFWRERSPSISCPIGRSSASRARMRSTSHSMCFFAAPALTASGLARMNLMSSKPTVPSSQS